MMKPYWIKSILALSFMIVSSLPMLGCGPGPPSYFDLYYLFNDDNSRSYDHLIRDGNIAEWNRFFDQTYDNISEIVYNYSIEKVQALADAETNKRYREAWQYLVYAKELGKTSARYQSTNDDWDYDDIIAKQTYNETLLHKGMDAFDTASSDEIKMRYAYQVIRYLHYTGNTQDAITYFEEYVEPMALRDEMYYYCLDQVSGCYAKEKMSLKAAMGFIKVVDKSIDRKASAKVSFGMGGKAPLDTILAHCSTKNERLLARTLTSFWHYNYDNALWIEENEFDEETLLSIYYYYDVLDYAKSYWMTPENYKNKSFYYYSDDEIAEVDKIQMNIDLLKKIANHPEIKNDDFWNMSIAYLSFQMGELKEAQTYINKISKATIVSEERLEFYRSFFNATGDGIVNDDVEDTLFRIYNTYALSDKDNWPAMHSSVYYTLLKSFYITTEHYLKANLVVMEREEVDHIFELKQLDSLEVLYKKPNKNLLEKFLLERSLGEVTSLADYIQEKKASSYLMTNQWEKAKEYFAGIPEDFTPSFPASSMSSEGNYPFDGYYNIPKEIFSINIKEGFEYPVQQMMTDDVYLHDDFDFIQAVFSKKDLTNYLIQLKKMSEAGNAEARYLLGNYYYNNSQFGYFRNILVYYPENNYCFYCKSDKILQNYNDISAQYFQKSLDGIKDRETRAKITYLMAKNFAFDVKDPDNYDHPYENEVKIGRTYRRQECTDLFDVLNTTYSDTQFYQDIIEECAIFALYVNE